MQAVAGRDEQTDKTMTASACPPSFLKMRSLLLLKMPK